MGGNYVECRFSSGINIDVVIKDFRFNRCKSFLPGNNIALSTFDRLLFITQHSIILVFHINEATARRIHKEHNLLHNSGYIFWHNFLISFLG